MAIILGLLCLIAPAAAAALFSLAVAGNNLAWGTPILCRILWGQKKFKPGPFYTGKFSTPIAIVALIFLAFGILLSMFPVGGPNPTRKYSMFPRLRRRETKKAPVIAQNMNYTVVINSAVWGGSLLYYFSEPAHIYPFKSSSANENA